MASAARFKNSKYADIDHTLFQQTKTTKNNDNKKTKQKLNNNSTAIIDKNTFQKLTGQTINLPSQNQAIDPNLILDSKDSVVITKDDINMIKTATSQVQSPQSVGQRSSFSSTDPFLSKKNNNNNNTQQSSQRFSQTAKLRKEKMLKMEKERLEHGEPNNEIEAEEIEKRSVLLNRAKNAMDEELDDVKHMNQMMLYAKCVTIRDAQIIEKQKILEEQLEEEKRLDFAMEVERLKTLKMQEEREAARLAEQRLGASVIVSQIAEREAERIRQQELREQESQLMLQRVKEAEEAAEEERRARVTAGRKLLSEVLEANNAQARAKLRRKLEEEREDEKIAIYLRQKEERERELEAAKQREREEKEQEIARLRAAQERAQDRQAAIDEVRARRYQESKDRKWRQEQLEQAQKREMIKRDIAEAREHQREEKAKRITEQAAQERAEYIRVLEWQQSQNSADEARIKAAQAKANAHRLDLLKQIQQLENEKREAKARYLEEGKIMSVQQELDKKKLLKLKEQKLEILERAGVPEKYRAELAKKKVLVASIH